MLRLTKSISMLALALIGQGASAHTVPTALPASASSAAVILAQSNNPKLPDPPKPPVAPQESPERWPDVPKRVDAEVDQAVHLLDVLHQKSETKLRVMEQGGDVIIYGEDGEPVSAKDAHKRQSQVNIKSALRKSNARLGFAVSLLLFVGYLILRGNTNQMRA